MNQNLYNRNIFVETLLIIFIFLYFYLFVVFVLLFVKKNLLGYLHKLFRYAGRTKGSRALFKVFLDYMNQKSQTPAETCNNLTLSKWKLCDWYYDSGGKERFLTKKPLDTDIHKEKRL